ncbi:MAG TPA: ABC transporter permease [Candidatus Binataceae bacterium]|jgi:phospholipid/cholesterol/gamma-HCH transport system permease protein|nr:ABC transporter permease [Candidatus Binataceae bacterium]
MSNNFPETASAEPRVAAQRIGEDAYSIRFDGDWTGKHTLPRVEELLKDIGRAPHPRTVVLDARGVGAWDSSFVGFIFDLETRCAQFHVALERNSLPAGAGRLIALAESVPEKADARVTVAHQGFFAALGNRTTAMIDAAAALFDFLGLLSIALGRFLTGRSRTRVSDIFEQMQACGADALAIVSLISFLVGVILAFMGAVQLERFGASIYVADLVAIGMLREMGAMMTAIIMAGRTGAAFAAQLGSMKVAQEIDAMTTMGISPIEFLCLPRVIALFLMMPILCVYSDLLGIVGGGFIGSVMLHVSPSAYFHETMSAFTMTDFTIGVVKAAIYGVLVGFAGCLRGFESGESSSAVGFAATSAVVTSIVMVVVACGISAFILNLVGI